MGREFFSRSKEQIFNPGDFQTKVTDYQRKILHPAQISHGLDYNSGLLRRLKH